MTALLEVAGLHAGYAGVSVLRDVDLNVAPGEVVALLGANGAGKSTLMKAVGGEIRPVRGKLAVLGLKTHSPLHIRVRHGLGFVTEERSVTASLSVRQNIAIGRCSLPTVLKLFPELEPLLSRRANVLSGGEQQMLALARALSRDGTKLLLADELSLGLAPMVVTRLLRAVRRAADEGLGVLLVEQHVHRVLEVADRVYVLNRGRVAYTGSAAESRRDIDEIRASYLGRSDR